jgi:predicted dehydrogenase
MAIIGFGIVGCGMIAHFHARAIADLRGAKLRAVFTSNPTHGESVVKEASGHADIHVDLAEMLARRDIDVVTICTPSGAHLEPAMCAARAKKHVVVEKPLEITLRRCDRLIAACRDTGVQLCTVFPSRFSAVNGALKKAVDAGRFGRLTLADTTVKWWRTQQYYDSGGWRGTWELDGGGALMNQAIHNVDLLQWIMGPVTHVAAFTTRLAHQRIEVEDTAVATLRFHNGALGVIEAATSVYPGLLKTIAVHGDAGSVVIEQDELVTWTFAKPAKPDEETRARFGRKTGHTGGASDPKAISHAGHARQFTDFVNAIRRGTTPLVDGGQGRLSVEIILAIYQSQATGKIVQLPLAKDPKLPKVEGDDR